MVMKTCYSCKQEKEESQFAWKNTKKGIRHGYCKECKKKYQRKYYAAHKEAFVAQITRNKNKRRDVNKARLKNYLLLHPCVDCGNNDIRVLHFDHIRDKCNEVTRMMHAGCCWAKIEEEIAKCEVRCANCHTIKTWPDRWN